MAQIRSLTQQITQLTGDMRENMDVHTPDVRQLLRAMRDFREAVRATGFASPHDVEGWVKVETVARLHEPAANVEMDTAADTWDEVDVKVEVKEETDAWDDVDVKVETEEEVEVKEETDSPEAESEPEPELAAWTGMSVQTIPMVNPEQPPATWTPSIWTAGSSPRSRTTSALWERRALRHQRDRREGI